jgi:polysaccharide export outer membrane protein
MSESYISRASRIATRAVLALGIVFAGLTAADAEELVDKYLLGPGDVINVIVLEDKELGGQALVRPDGKITMPLAGAIRAAGRSPEEVAAVIRSRLSTNFVEPPSVTAALVSMAAKSEEIAAAEAATEPRDIYVIGEVGRPGRFEYDPERRINIMQALSLAGGLSPFAARARIQVREVTDEGETVRTVDFNRIEMGGAGDLTELADGAVIVVPERGFMEFD